MSDDNVVDITSKVSDVLSKREILAIVEQALDASGDDTFDGFVFVGSSAEGGIPIGHRFSPEAIAQLLMGLAGYTTILNKVIVEIMMAEETMFEEE